MSYEKQKIRRKKLKIKWTFSTVSILCIVVTFIVEKRPKKIEKQKNYKKTNE